MSTADTGAPELTLLAINLTRRCNLACEHCYLDAETLHTPGDSELTTGEVCGLLDEVAALDQGTMIVLTGGEPLARDDLEPIIAHGAKSDLAMVVGSNGVMLTEKRVQSLQRAGLLGIGISVDSLDPVKHDAFRGLTGAWAKTMAGIENCRRQGLDFQLHFSISSMNEGELEAMIAFARDSGARVLNVFFLICTGRGEQVTDLSPAAYELAIERLIEAQARHDDLIIRTRCAPYFKRIAHQRQPASPLNRISGREGDGCVAGIHYCRVTPKGGVTACPYIEQEVGNVRGGGFSELWRSVPDFEALRSPVLGGKCGVCEYRKLCGGCRARPLAAGGDLLDADPFCLYQPVGGEVIEPLGAGEMGVEWSPAAEQRLFRVPSFLRRMVSKRAEAYAVELGASEVLAEHLEQLVAKRFGGKIKDEHRTSNVQHRMMNEKENIEQ
ncbi:MAG: radical SAM protein [Pseudomonadota bacterium]|nr:radical SAM protein [Pseudomonadota bacterium]